MEEIVLFNPIIFEVLQQHSCCMMGLLHNGEVLQQPLSEMRSKYGFRELALAGSFRKQCSKFVCDLGQSTEHGGAFGRRKSAQEIFAETLDALDAFIEQGLSVRGERDLNRAAVFGILHALKEIFFHEGFDELGHGRRREFHGFRKFFQRNAVRFFLGQAAHQSHGLMLADADVDGGDVSNIVDRFAECVVKA